MAVTGRVFLSLAILLAACVPRGRHEESAPRSASPGSGKAASQPAGRATFGALVRDLPPRERRALEPPPAVGVLVGEVIVLGPAARAGLRTRDVIVALDGTAVKTPCDLFKRLAAKKPGESVAFSMQRRNATFDAAIVLDEAAPLYTLACDTGDAAGCMLLAWEKKKTGNAVDLFKKACDWGLADGCAAAGKAYLDGEEISQDTRQSLALFERGCLQGSASACASEAFQYATGRGVPQDDVRATERYVKACDGGDPSGCYNFGLMAETGRGTDQDFTRAVTAYTEGCDGGSYLACTNLGFLVENGRGTPADEAKAAGFYRRACEGDGCGDRDTKGCLNLGICALHGRGIPEDPARAAGLFRQACDGGEADACSRLKAQ
jgi:TPR repeat protein